MSNPTSYVCERSVEYMLLPNIMISLRKQFDSVVAIYPWITREGGVLSRNLHGHTSYRVLSVYARRPKLYSEADRRVKFKFNEKIIRGAGLAKFYGIPAIAGCPVARNFHELSVCQSFLWSDLSTFSEEEIDLTIEIDQEGHIPKPHQKHFLHSVESVSELVVSSAKPMTFFDFLEAVREVEAGSKGYVEYSSMLFRGGYKPVYILLS